MKANEMKPGPWDQSRQALKEFQRRHDDMRGPIAVRCFELQDDLAIRGSSHPFVAKGGTSDVATEAFEGQPLMRPALHGGARVAESGKISCDQGEQRGEQLLNRRGFYEKGLYFSYTRKIISCCVYHIFHISDHCYPLPDLIFQSA